MRRWIITYDIADDERRYRLARLLGQRLERVQESVFEGILSGAEIDDTLAEARKIIEESADKLRAYPVSRRTDRRRVGLGTQPQVQSPSAYWIF